MTSRDLFLGALREKPSGELRKGYIWHIGNIEYFSDNTGYFAVGRTTNSTIDIAWIAEPKQMNARLDRQAGSFLLSGNRDLRIQSILDSEPYANVTMYKFRVAHDLYTGIFALLRKMNITSKSLLWRPRWPCPLNSNAIAGLLGLNHLLT